MFKFLSRKKEVVKNTYTQEEYNRELNSKADLQKAFAALYAQKVELQSKIDVIISESDKLKALVREQTEADLFVNALKGVGIIPKKPDEDVFAERDRLSSMQQQAMNMNAIYSSGYASMLQGSGLFGR